MDTKFRAVRDKSGKLLPGLYESDICRVEREQDGSWITEVPMRQIGGSAFMEYRPLSMGGQWVRIGRFRVRAGATSIAERLRYGELVFDSSVSRDGEKTVVRLVQFAAVIDEIRKYQ